MKPSKSTTTATDPLAEALDSVPVFYKDTPALAAIDLRAALDAAGYEVRPKGEIAAERARIRAAVEDYLKRGHYCAHYDRHQTHKAVPEAKLIAIIDGANDAD